MSYEFLGEVDAFDYLDAMYNDGVTCESYIEDHLYGTYAELDAEGRMRGERKEGAWTPAQQISQELESTWGEIEMLPTTEGTWYL